MTTIRIQSTDETIKYKNITSFSQFCHALCHPELKLTLSSREVRADYDLMHYIKIFFMPISGTSQIESIYGSTTLAVPLYGGRSYDPEHSLTNSHLDLMQNQNIGLALTLSNHLFDQDSYKKSWDLLERHHQEGNSIICVSDKLAKHIRQDFPGYTLKASVIKNLKSVSKVENALKLYDQVVTPMEKNSDDDFLNALPEKKRIVLFGNASCGYTCPAHTCYIGFSQHNQNKKVTGYCSEKKIPRLNIGHTYFDIEKYINMGFHRIKLIPMKSEVLSEITQQYSS